MAEHIVAVFRTEAAAAAAEQSLENIGISRTTIRRYSATEGRTGNVVPASETSTSTHTGGGFWSWLLGEDAASQTTRSAYTHDAYERSAVAGNVVLSVTVEDAKIHEAISALEAHDPVDIDERTDEVAADETSASLASRSATSTVGQDYSTSTVAEPAATSTGVPGGRATPSLTPVVPVASETTSETSSLPAGVTPHVADTLFSTGTSPTGTVGAETGEQVIPLAEEQLEIGKRTVDRGTTRIRRYVVEKPVEESVNLRTERVTVERRQPLEGASVPGAGAFEERIVEVRETAEEPVVAKTAHVAEEVVIGRESTERTETVKDTVRREEVDVTKDAEPPR